MDLAQGVRAAVARGRQSGSYLGTVTAIDATALALTVDIGTGTPLTGVRWVGSYAPVVGDFVTVLRAGTSWIVLGKLSKDLTGPGYIDQAVEVQPSAMWRGQMMGRDPGDSSWAWLASGPLYQGADVGSPPWLYGALLMYPTIAQLIPAGATIQTARITLTRDWDDDMPSTRRPRMWGHTATAPPSGMGGPESVIAAGYGPWTPGSLTQGETGTWALPSAWLTALLSGALQGIALYSTSAGEAMRLLPLAPITITYRLPA